MKNCWLKRPLLSKMNSFDYYSMKLGHIINQLSAEQVSYNFNNVDVLKNKQLANDVDVFKNKQLTIYVKIPP